MITVFTILGTRHYLLDYPNLHDTYNELYFVKSFTIAGKMFYT